MRRWGEILRGVQNDGQRGFLRKENAEPWGYLSVCQTPNGVIHLISSKNHYEFNLAWLKEPPPPVP